MKKIYLIFVLLVFISTGCEDFLDRKDENAGFVTEEDVWADKDKVRSMANRLYECTTWWFESRYDWSGRHAAGPGKNYADISILSGEAVCTRPVPTITQLVYGDWESAVRNSFANPDFYHCWEDMWEAVYVSNVILDGIDGEIDPRMTKDEHDQIKGEAFLYRALSYYEISRRWGQMPYFKERMLPDMDLNVERPATFLEQVDDIVQDCDSAAYYLPEVSYLNDPINMGRMGKAAAMGLKSKALTTAASPNFAEGNATQLWERAAKAAWDVIQLSRSSEKLGLYTGDYNEMFHTLPGTIENVWPRYFKPIGPGMYVLNWQWKSVKGYHGYSPTQELVEHFETADGWPIDDPRSGYNPQDPYTNRDPRFYKDILYHGSLWSKTAENQVLDMKTSPKLGADRSSPNGNDFGNSKTGYLPRKMNPDKWNQLQSSYNVPKYVNMPYMRMAEIYLNYAEAVNEAYKDPNAMAPGADLSAVDALNKIRDRVGQVPVRSEFTSDYATFQKRVRNEFYVELCFEFHIWHDMMRWRTAENYDQYNFHGVLVIDDDTQPTGVRYEKFEIPIERHFDKNKHYRYPLRVSDLQLYDNLKQNPGW